MLGKIVSILGDTVKIKLEINLSDLDNIMGKNVIFEEPTIKIVGEILEGDTTYLNINLIGEIKNNKFIYGSSVKPSFRDNCRIITPEELDIIYQNDPSTNAISMGSSVVYDNYKISLDVNAFFSNHFAILGNSGSGKSYSTSKILQSIFYDFIFLLFSLLFFWLKFLFWLSLFFSLLLSFFLLFLLLLLQSFSLR